MVYKIYITPLLCWNLTLLTDSITCMKHQVRSYFAHLSSSRGLLQLLSSSTSRRMVSPSLGWQAEMSKNKTCSFWLQTLQLYPRQPFRKHIHHTIQQVRQLNCLPHRYPQPALKGAFEHYTVFSKGRNSFHQKDVSILSTHCFEEDAISSF